ncbi:MAG: hypothetical protein WD708_04670 [Kiritimatiellia bacterium]
MKLQWRTFFALLILPLSAQPLEGFVEGRLGGRLQSDPGQDSATIRELRLQVGKTHYAGPLELEVKADLLYDDLDGYRNQVDVRTGGGWVDVRTASAAFRPTMWMDVKAGRQVLTWGTGDLLFLNDLFPKDWQSFFNGRDLEYLKAPSDAVWISVFPGDWTLDVVWTPRFNSDRYLDGDGISFFPGTYTPDNPLPVDEPDGMEWSLRAARHVGSVETAMYAYEGYWKSPGGMDAEGRGIFPELRVWGASVLFPAAGGLLNAETAYYDSLEDRQGTNPGVNNSEARFLLGYTRELKTNLTMGVQGYAEWMRNYDAYTETQPEMQPARDEWRRLGTLRLTRHLMNQKMMLSGFVFYSPTDQDMYLRGSVEYAWSDQWMTTLGANAFAGEKEHTFFGQFEDNSNLYVAIRRWF